MVSSRVWGILGILTAVVGVIVIAPEVLHSLQTGHVGPELLYGVAVLVTALVTLLVVGRGVLAAS